MLSPHDYTSTPDTDLVADYKESGDLVVLGELYRRYMGMVYGVCVKYLKDREESRDAVMQVFEKLVPALKAHDVANFKSWLYVMAKNHCLMQLRAAKGKNFEEIKPGLMENDPAGHPEDGLDMEANLTALERCIETLVVEQKQCVRLFYLQQKCYKEITEQTGYELGKVKSYIQNGKRNLKICMEQNA